MRLHVLFLDKTKTVNLFFNTGMTTRESNPHSSSRNPSPQAVPSANSQSSPPPLPSQFKSSRKRAASPGVERFRAQRDEEEGKAKAKVEDHARGVDENWKNQNKCLSKMLRAVREIVPPGVNLPDIGALNNETRVSLAYKLVPAVLHPDCMRRHNLTLQQIEISRLAFVALIEAFNRKYGE